MAIVALGVFIVAYAFIATERIHKVKVALGGAAVVLALGIVDSQDVFYSHETGIDWDVIFLLLARWSSSGCFARLVASNTQRSGRPNGPVDPRCG